MLVSTEDRQVVDATRIELDADHAGEGWIEFQGGDVYLVVAPWDHTAQGYHYNWDRAESWSYTWNAELTDGTDPEDPEDPDDTGYDKVEDLPDRPNGEDDPGGVGMPGCGCASGGAAPAGALLGLLGVLGVARRRD